MPGKVIGIDLGTTNSVVAVYEAGEPVVVPNQQGARLTPSVIGFQDDGSRLVGQLAKRQAVQNPRNTVFSIKRFMGRRHKEVENEEKMVPYEITGGPEDLVKVKISDKEYTPPEISAMVLKELKEAAEAYLGETVTDAVVTVPAYFNDSQRQATKDAGTIAGLNVKRIINEPTAAGFAYGLNKKKDATIAVFDLGGGTFDITILEISDVDGEQVFEVKSTNGDTHLGGDDFDEALINHLADQFKQEHGVDLRQDQMALQRLKEAAEKAKIELSSTPNTTVNLPFITQDPATKNPVHLNISLSRSKFEQLGEPIFNRVVGPCKNAIEDAKIAREEIDEVILVGGSTRIPRIQQIVEDVFGKKPSKQVNPDEAVALGAAIQGHILSDDGGEGTNITLLDVTPLSLGVEVEGGIMHTLIPRNTTIPTQKKETFSTAADQQPAVDVQVFQGERQMAKDNRLLGHFKLDGIRPAPRGVPQIEVAFDIDANGILNVAAKDLDTGKEQTIKIESSSGLTPDEIEKMKSDAEKYASEDKARKEEAEVKNQAEHLEYQARKQLKDYADNLPDNIKSKIEGAADKIKSALEQGNVDAIKSAKEEMESVMKDNEVTEAIYKAVNEKQAQQTGNPGAESGSATNDQGDAPDAAKAEKTGGDDVIDAEYTVKDDENKG